MNDILIQRIELAGRLLHRGVTLQLLPDVLKIPQLASFFPHSVIAPDTALVDEWASDHFQHFGMNVTPNASMYLDPEGMLGGVQIGWLQELYAWAGFIVPAGSEGPDHISNELTFLAHLLRQCQISGTGPDLRRSAEWSALAGRFLDQHLLGWLPVFTFAVQRQGDPFYSAVARVVFEDVLAAARSLPGTRSPAVHAEVNGAESLLSDPDTHIRDISRYLLTPVRSGVLLSRDRIAYFGRSTRLPRGFGDRLQILNNLIHSAANYEMVGGILDLLEQELEAWLLFYEDLRSAEFMQAVADYWASQVRVSLQMVARMKMETE